MASDVDMITATITVPRGIWPEVLDYAARRTAEYVRGVPATPPSSMASDPNGAPATGRTYAVRDLVAATNERGTIVYRTLAMNAGKPVLIDELSLAVGFRGLQAPGLLGSMGRSMRSRGFRNASCAAGGSYWWWSDLGLEFPGGEGKTPPDNVVWGWDGVNRTLTMPTAIGAEFREALA